MNHEMFKPLRVSKEGLDKLESSLEAFDRLLTEVESLAQQESRELAIVRTKLQEASFFATRAIAQTYEVSNVE